MTSMKKDDVIFTLNNLGVISYLKGAYVIVLTNDMKKTYEKSLRVPKIDPNALHFIPKDWSKRAKW